MKLTNQFVSMYTYTQTNTPWNRIEMNETEWNETKRMKEAN